MPTCNAKSSVPHHSNHWENCQEERLCSADYQFNKDQYYEGEFYGDSMHGQGSYEWVDVAVYEGGFYSNYKEGYARVSLPDNSCFEGLFVRNVPFGPGILTYACGRQDAGFWMGRKLVRLSRVVNFIIPRLAPTPAAKLKLLQFRRLIPLDEENWDLSMDTLKKCGYPFEHFYSPYSSLIYDPRSVFFDTLAFEKTYFNNPRELFAEFTGSPKNNSPEPSEHFLEENQRKSVKEIPTPSHCLCQNEFVMQYKDVNVEDDICDRKSESGEMEMGILGYFTKFGTLEELEQDEENDLEVSGEGSEAEDTENESRTCNIVSWNRSELCSDMLKQIFRYRAHEGKLNFDLGKLMIGARNAFRRTGLKEKECLQFLKMCSIGPAHVIKDFFCTYDISEELMDARGNNSLMFAAAADQHDIIDVLLDFGVDVNTFNDEHLTPLNLCLLRRLALTRGICNWEMAFLPREIEGTQIYPQSTDDEILGGISSLDRIFGDGMSINDSKSRFFEGPLPSLCPLTFPCNEFAEKEQLQCRQFSEESKDLSDVSQITVFNITKSSGSRSLIQANNENENQTHEFAKRSVSCLEARDSSEALRPLGSNEETPKTYIKVIPKSIRTDEYEKSVKESTTDKYLFEFTFKKNPKETEQTENKKVESPGKPDKKKSGKQVKEEEQEKEEVEEVEVVEGLMDSEQFNKIMEIDKTIIKLLQGRADPNISESPKPSIHLGIYTKDLGLVNILLLYKANPNKQLYLNEGLLTPLHVLVLLPSAREYVEICGLFLNFGADPEMETSPDFILSEKEKEYLDPTQGRIPLQLLCMRPDLEYADPEDNLIDMAIMLARETNRKCLYNGHSCLTLAMLTGNIRLFTALLESKLFDPNEVLEKDRGTALHVLVSTELQRRSSFESSKKMCDKLIAENANPLKVFKKPKRLHGTCVEYGYREIEAEIEARKTQNSENVETKKSNKVGKEKNAKEKTVLKDYLDNHIKIVEYLDNIACSMARKKKGSIKEQEKKRGSSKKKHENNKKALTELSERPPESDMQKKANNQDDKAGDKDEKESKRKNSPKQIKRETDRKKKEVKNKKEKTEEANRKKEVERNNKERRTEDAFRKDEENKKEEPKGKKKESFVKTHETTSELFPEGLRQKLLKIYGEYATVDINEFLLPYVVLRDGQLYYRFQGNEKTPQEQYSLI